MFYDTKKLGLVWHYKDELTWRQWFAITWRGRSVAGQGFFGTFVVLTLLCVAASGSDVLFEQIPGGFWSALLVSAVIGTVLFALPTHAANHLLASMYDSPEFRFGDMLEGGPRSRFNQFQSSPTMAVLRVYEGVKKPFVELPDGVRAIFNQWLYENWEDDRRVCDLYGNEFEPQVERERWEALRARIDSFWQLRGLGVEPGLERTLNELDIRWYFVAKNALQAQAAAISVQLAVYTRSLEHVNSELEAFEQQDPARANANEA